jgi:hypothetical protein
VKVGNEVRANKRIHVPGPREPWPMVVRFQHASPRVMRGHSGGDTR